MEEGNNVLRDLLHRVDLLEKTAHEVEVNHKRDKRSLEEQRINHEGQMSQLRDELKEITELCELINKTMHNIGSELPSLSPKGQVQEVLEQAQTKNYAEFIPRDELLNTFELIKQQAKLQPTIKDNLSHVKAHVMHNYQMYLLKKKQEEDVQEDTRKKDPIFG
jgi:hypothetical protein